VVSDSEQFKNYYNEEFNVIGVVTFSAMVSYTISIQEFKMASKVK
jgi:hypothetical protein